MGKIRWHRVVLEYWSLEKVFKTSRYNFLCKRIEENLWYFLFACVHTRGYGRRTEGNKKKRETLERSAVYMFLFFMGAFQVPRDEKSVSYLSLCFKGG